MAPFALVSARTVLALWWVQYTIVLFMLVVVSMTSCPSLVASIIPFLDLSVFAQTARLYPLVYCAFFYYGDSLRRHLPYIQPLFYYVSLVGLQFIIVEVARDLLVWKCGCVAVASGT